MLMLHPLQVFTTKESTSPIHETPIFAWGIAFPPSTHTEERVEYVVSTQWLRENFLSDIDDDEMEPSVD
jgi:hypothetical protein